VSLLLSIVIPVFNSEDFLPRVIENIYQQGLSNYEVLVVDDGSEGYCEEIVNVYKKSCNNLSYLPMLENSGPFAARRYGVSKAVGEYIGFVDCDDLITLDYFSNLLKVASKNQADCVKSISFTLRDCSKISTVVRSKFDTLSFSIDNVSCLELMFTKSDWHNRNNLWSGVYKRSLWSEFSYCSDIKEKLHFAEDLLEVVYLLSSARNIILVDEPGYFYCSDNDSSTTKSINELLKFEKALKSCVTVFNQVKKWLGSHDQFLHLVQLNEDRFLSSVKYLISLIYGDISTKQKEELMHLVKISLGSNSRFVL
jgi:glycosyltransferase involved in cell wall biosynthesis